MIWTRGRLTHKEAGAEAPKGAVRSRKPHGLGLSHAAEGFTLVETLAAFAILALVLTVLLSGISRMVTADERARLLREASRLAQSKLDTIGVLEPIVAGETAGRFGNEFSWQLKVRRDDRVRFRQVSGFWVEVRVTAPKHATLAPVSVSLTTFKLSGIGSK